MNKPLVNVIVFVMHVLKSHRSIELTGIHWLSFQPRNLRKNWRMKVEYCIYILSIHRCKYILDSADDQADK